jgi:hypothetical protein
MKTNIFRRTENTADGEAENRKQTVGINLQNIKNGR